ncbi:hypothetical protein CR513_19857, partial [Mucuna pruriens]
MGVRVGVITRRDLINDSYFSNRKISGRLIPKRGQVKLGIVVGIVGDPKMKERIIIMGGISVLEEFNHLYS